MFLCLSCHFSAISDDVELNSEILIFQNHLTVLSLKHANRCMQNSLVFSLFLRPEYFWVLSLVECASRPSTEVFYFFNGSNG